MRVALISICETCTDASHQPRGLLPMADGTLAQYQMKQAMDAGAAKVIVFVQAMAGQVMLLEDYAAKNRIALVMLRNVSEITAHVAPDDDVLLIADGLYADSALVRSVWDAEEPNIATLSAGTDTQPSHFERMDINHFWAGLAKLRGSDLLPLADLPGDWSMQSAALRSGVQRDYRRVMLSDQVLERKEMAFQTSSKDIERAEKQVVFSTKNTATRLSERFLAAPIARYLAPHIWRRSFSRNILRAIQILGCVLAPAAAYFVNIPIAIFVLFTAIFAGYMRQSLFGVFEPAKNLRYLGILYWISIAAILAIGLHKAALAPAIVTYLSLTSVGLYWYYINKTDLYGDFFVFLRDPLWFALLLGIAGLLGQLPFAIMAIGLIILGSMIFPKRNDKPLKNSKK